MKAIQIALLLSNIGLIVAETETYSISWAPHGPEEDTQWKALYPHNTPLIESDPKKFPEEMERIFNDQNGDRTAQDGKTGIHAVFLDLNLDQVDKLMAGLLKDEDAIMPALMTYTGMVRPMTEEEKAEEKAYAKMREDSPVQKAAAGEEEGAEGAAAKEATEGVAAEGAAADATSKEAPPQMHQAPEDRIETTINKDIDPSDLFAAFKSGRKGLSLLHDLGPEMNAGAPPQQQRMRKPGAPPGPKRKYGKWDPELVAWNDERQKQEQIRDRDERPEGYLRDIGRIYYQAAFFDHKQMQALDARLHQDKQNKALMLFGDNDRYDSLNEVDPHWRPSSISFVITTNPLLTVSEYSDLLNQQFKTLWEEYVSKGYDVIVPALFTKEAGQAVKPTVDAEGRYQSAIGTKARNGNLPEPYLRIISEYLERLAWHIHHWASEDYARIDILAGLQYGV